ncbi:hypothetical protein MASR2M70_13820 [Bacillota bacterium]
MQYREIRVEGFEIHKLLSQCLKEGITLRNIHTAGECEFTAVISEKDWQKFCGIAKNRYNLSVIGEKGIKQLLRRLFPFRFTLPGVIVFCVIIAMQTAFISEIRVYGFEKLPERQILEALEASGLYVGCSRSLDLERVKIEMHRRLDRLSWIGITLKGGLAEVTVAEGTIPGKQIDKAQPCHVVAGKEGYIVKTIAREGKPVVEKDDFVHVGEMLISGIIEIKDKTYTSDPGNPPLRYVHSEGEVYAKTVYRFIRYQELYDIEKRKTGRSIPGLRVKIGAGEINTTDFFTAYDTSDYKERRVFGIFWPIPAELYVNRVSELELFGRIRGDEEIEAQANRQTREFIKTEIPESTQIINKSLKFLPGENIIKVTILIEALEEIGQQKTFIP